MTVFGMIHLYLAASGNGKTLARCAVAFNFSLIMLSFQIIILLFFRRLLLRLFKRVDEHRHLTSFKNRLFVYGTVIGAGILKFGKHIAGRSPDEPSHVL